IAIVLAGSMVAVVGPKGREAVEHVVDVLDQAVLGIVDVHAGSNVHGADQDHAVSDGAAAQDLLDRAGDVEVLPPLRSIEREVFSVELHQTVSTRPESRMT